MIIYGSRSKQLAQETLSQKCSHCGTANSLDLHVFQKYAHVFWIPFFPVGKTGVSQCSHCKQILRSKEMPTDLRNEYDNLKARTKTPLWMFIGLALVAVLIVAFAVDENKKSAASAQYIQHLQPNDLLATKVEEGYTYLKVTAVQGDSVYLKGNKQAATLKSGLDKLGTDASSFSDEEFVTTQKSLQDQFKAEKIFSVIRR